MVRGGNYFSVVRDFVERRKASGRPGFLFRIRRVAKEPAPSSATRGAEEAQKQAPSVVDAHASRLIQQMKRDLEVRKLDVRMQRIAEKAGLRRQ